MADIEEFNPLVFEKKLTQLKDTQESIQGLSSWCLKQKVHHKKIVASWLNVLKRVKVEQRLVLFYLANDVIQYSKRKNFDFVESWGLNLQKATPLVRDEKVRHKILRIFKIWEQRSVYDEEFLSDLTGLLSAGAIKKTDDDPLDFQPQQLVNKIKQCTVLEADTDLRLKFIHESPLPLSDTEVLCANLKERSNKDDVDKEVTEGIQCVERYTQALQREIVAREALLALLSTANQYYSTQRGEVKVVAYAYKNFGARVRALKRKLDELIPTLPNAAPSPPQRDEDVPSPGPDEDIDLPNTGDNDEDISYNIDRTFNTSMSADGTLYNLGLSSFLNTDNSLNTLFNDSDISANRIEVINTRPNEKQDFDINNFLKTLSNDSNVTTTENSVNNVSKKGDTLPGLDLLTPDSVTNPPPPTSFYGTADINDDPEPYHPEMTTQWDRNAWSLPPAPVPPPTMIPPPTAVPPPLIGRDFDAPPPLNPLIGRDFEAPPPLLPRDFSQAPPPARIGREFIDVPPPPLISRDVFADTPESPPPAPPTKPVPIVPLYARNVPDLPSADVDHRGILPPPPPPPVLPLLGNLEDVDHRLLPTIPPPVAAPRHSTPVQDVDHRNLVSLTRAPPPPIRPLLQSDQDYRVPPVLAPSDIVESVDMDLSEDEDQQGHYNSEHRRHSFNNNKVLVGGDNGKTNHDHHNLVHIKRDEEGPHTAPALPSMPNPFDNMPPRKNFEDMGQKRPFPFPTEDQEENSNDSAYEDDLRSRGIEYNRNLQDDVEPEWQQRPNQRFPRNWGPRTNYRPPFGPQMWPRNGPRPPNRWMGPRPRFW